MRLFSSVLTSWKTVLVVYILFFLICVAQSFYVLDPDFGWHYRLGQLILRKGIQYSDPFSYTMPHFPAIDHEWLSNVLLASMYNKVGMLGLSIIYSCIVLASLYVLSLTIQKTARTFTVLPIVLTGITLLSFISIRVQLETWLLFSVTYFCTSTEGRWQKYRLFLPLLFVVWANLHGGFVIGLLVLGIFFGVRFYEKKLSRKDTLVLLFCLLATFVTPYGKGVWQEEVRSLFDASLRTRILEWFPAWDFPDLLTWTYIGISIALLYFSRFEFSLYKKALFAALLVVGITTERNIPFVALVSLPFTTEAFVLLYKKATHYVLGKERFFIVYAVICAVCVLPIFIQGASTVQSASKSTLSSYPVQAVSYVTTHFKPGNIFAPYEWGGYIEWKAPESKVFIDGRMPSWKTQGSLHGDSSDAFSDYIAIVTGKESFATASKKYHITTVVWHNKEREASDSIFIVPLFSGNKKEVNAKFLQSVLEAGFREVYEDSVSVVYTKQPAISQ